MEFEIIGKNVFGHGFMSSHDEDYANLEDNGFSVLVAKQYGAEPCCQIRVANIGITINVYKLVNQYGADYKSDNGLFGNASHTWINTVNPAAIVEHFVKKLS